MKYLLECTVLYNVENHETSQTYRAKIMLTCMMSQKPQFLTKANSWGQDSSNLPKTPNSNLAQIDPHKACFMNLTGPTFSELIGLRELDESYPCLRGTQ